MKLVKIQKELVDRFSADPEFLYKDGRPCVLIIQLKYKTRKQDFAIPFRSNIPSNVPKDQYFAFPPRSTTKAFHRHGLHYIKMFPIEKQYFQYYRTDNDSSKLMLDILKKNEKNIIQECQQYLAKYEKNERPQFSTDIDFLLSLLHPDPVNNRSESK